MHRTPSKVVIFCNFSAFRPRWLGLRPRSLWVSVVEFAIYIYLFICKPRINGFFIGCYWGCVNNVHICRYLYKISCFTMSITL